jgi:hypothetical protein
MLRRLTLGFAGVLTAAIAIAACSSSDATQSLSIGPTFAAETLYAANVTANAIDIYTPNPKSTAGPEFQIGGGATNLQAPQYLAFDASDNLWVTNWLASTSVGSILQFKPEATGDVLPFLGITLGAVHPRGIADFTYTLAGATTVTDAIGVGIVDPSQPAGFQSGVALYFTAVGGAPFETIAGPDTGLNVPSGVAFDSRDNLYVANLQSASVEVFQVLPSPTASPTPGTTATPKPTTAPIGATPTPPAAGAPTPTPLDQAPEATIAGAATGIGVPVGLALDSFNNIYVADQAATVPAKLCAAKCPAILIFPPGSSGAIAPTVLAGANTLLAAPTDVKVDTHGNIYVADTAAGRGVIYMFTGGVSGNVAPAATLEAGGALIGLGLNPNGAPVAAMGGGGLVNNPYARRRP